MASPVQQLTDLSLEIYALAAAARGCSSYEGGLRIAAQVRKCGERLVDLSPRVMDDMTDKVLREIMDRKFPELRRP